MSYTATATFNFGTSQAGLVDLVVQPLTAAGVATGDPVAGTFVDLTGGAYGWTGSVPDDAAGGRAYRTGDPTVWSIRRFPEAGVTLTGATITAVVAAVTNASMTLAELTVAIGAYIERAGGLLASLVFTGGIPQGTGDIVVNHDTGGADNLALKTSGGAGVDDARITAYVESEYLASGRVPRDTSRTDPLGRWRKDMHLAAGTYRFVFDRAGHPSVSVTQVVE